MELKKTIFALSEAAGPSGHEHEAVKLAGELLKPYVDAVTHDVLGNLIGIRSCGKKNARCILLDAHLDEVCLLVTGHDKGFLKFRTIGIDARMLPGLEVKLCTEPPVYGVVNCLPPHILSAEEREKPFDEAQLRIDCGMNEQEAIEKIPVGTYAVYATKPFMMGGKLVCGKSLDNRACFAVLVRTMELLKDRQISEDICVLGSLQEEFGGLGATTGCFSMLPDRAIVVDVTFGATPDSPKDETFALGKGVTVGFGPTLNRKMSLGLERCAKDNNLPVSREILEGNTGTNSMQTQISREGVASACVSLPLRYMHTPIEAVHLDDAENAAQLLAAYLMASGVDENA